ncbi:THUMP domain-containing protein 1 homolog isoform X2 [Macadamia integrifolia]|uniref:THUMP domain-containing protein 1 homolog isoform X2 n=1 Tax=Macadamia integrifolia TaxID=60698 RepID=UPI001C531474|nr:THUMP domain-containing protein 1 homolog isoform X2 [Macadamia integrifolia]
MAAEDKPQTGNSGTNKKRKQRYRSHNKPVKKGSYPLRPGVQGFFITCDGGREKQASQEAINVIDTFYEELVYGQNYGAKRVAVPNKPLNKITKFSDSDSSSEEDDDEDDKSDRHEDEKVHENQAEEKSDFGKLDAADSENQNNEKVDSQKEDDATHDKQRNETEEVPTKKQRLQTDASNGEKVVGGKMEEKSIDKLIEAELEELGDRNKRRFVSLDAGCNGIVFIQMHKREGDPSPKEIVQHMMMSAASTRKHMSRFILRVLPVEVACYASEEEISRAIKPLIAKYFPTEAPTPQKFAVLYDARANTGVERMSIINSVAKSVLGPYKVDLNNPDKSIIVQVAKTICLIGVVEKYKELSKYNLRQLTSPKP